jgi:thiol:disulfide interchange protein DsbC
VARADFGDEFREKFPDVKGAQITKSFGNFYAVKSPDSSLVFISDDFKILISGTVLDLLTSKQLSLAGKSVDKTTINLQDLRPELAIQLGHGNRHLYVFSDPQCPYCQKLEKNFDKLDDVTIHVLPLPIEELHPSAKMITTQIWCSGEPPVSWSNYLLYGMVPQVLSGTDCRAPIDSVAAVAMKYGIHATPTLVFEDGSVVAGAMDPLKINATLSLVARSLKEQALKDREQQ